MNASYGHFNLWGAARWQDVLESCGFGDVSIRGYFTLAAAEWIGEMELRQNRRRERRAPEEFFRQRQADFHRMLAESIGEERPEGSACLLCRARRTTGETVLADGG